MNSPSTCRHCGATLPSAADVLLATRHCPNCFGALADQVATEADAQPAVDRDGNLLPYFGGAPSALRNSPNTRRDWGLVDLSVGLTGVLLATIALALLIALDASLFGFFRHDAGGPALHSGRTLESAEFTFQILHWICSGGMLLAMSICFLAHPRLSVASAWILIVLVCMAPAAIKGREMLRQKSDAALARQTVRPFGDPQREKALLKLTDLIRNDIARVMALVGYGAFLGFLTHAAGRLGLAGLSWNMIGLCGVILLLFCELMSFLIVLVNRDPGNTNRYSFTEVSGVAVMLGILLTQTLLIGKLHGAVRQLRQCEKMNPARSDGST